MGLMRDLALVRSDSFAQVVVKQEVTHRKPLLLSPEPIIVETWVSHMGNSSYTIQYRIIDEVGDVAALASSLMAVVDPATDRPIRMSPQLRALLVPLTLTT